MKQIINGQQVEVKNIGFETPVEHWTEYKLANGNVARIKFVLASIYDTGSRNPNGSPLYVFNGQPMCEVIEVSADAPSPAIN